MIDDSPEENFEDEDDNGFGDSEDGFDDMEEIPLDITEAVSIVKKPAKPTSKPQTKVPAKIVRAQYISTGSSNISSFLIRKQKNLTRRMFPKFTKRICRSLQLPKK